MYKCTRHRLLRRFRLRGELFDTRGDRDGFPYRPKLVRLEDQEVKIIEEYCRNQMKHSLKGTHAVDVHQIAFYFQVMLTTLLRFFFFLCDTSSRHLKQSPWRFAMLLKTLDSLQST